MQQHGAYILSADLPLHSHLDPGGGVNRSKFNFFRTWSCCITNYREWSIEHHASTYSLGGSESTCDTFVLICIVDKSLCFL